jgi:uncharacterized protein (DUF1697 family)
MKELKALLESGGASEVTTVIQSGNVVLDSEQPGSLLAEQTRQAIELQFNFSPQVMVVPADEYLLAVNANPFPKAVAEPKTLHAFFANQSIQVDQQALAQYKAEGELISAVGRVLWLHAPDGIGRSKLVTHIAKITQCDTTARNWNTLSKLRDLIS